ncbi:MAG: hypothetical protein PHW04_13320 [Candidatus Wallbacteria bacterium]|nr:hypothetical protein [Candidatus Wallbacteria bacterium]
MNEFKPIIDSLIRVVYYQGNGLPDLVVRYWPKLRQKPEDRYSHVAVIRNAEKIESEPGKGVQLINWNEMTCICTADVYEIRDLTAGESEAGWAWLNTQVGRKYDWQGIIGYASQTFGQDPDRWFCSELVEQMSENIGRKLIPGLRPNEINPQMQSHSDRLLMIGSFMTVMELKR